jgi:hypothetical protein
MDKLVLSGVSTGPILSRKQRRRIFEEFTRQEWRMEKKIAQNLRRLNLTPQGHPAQYSAFCYMLDFVWWRHKTLYQISTAEPLGGLRYRCRTP